MVSPHTTEQPPGRGILFVLSGPSGVGKTSLCRRTIAEMPDVKQSVSYTTRARRSEERDGQAYHFVSQKSFEQRIEAGEFLEWARVHGHLYGTSRQQIEQVTRRGSDILLAIDVQGATQLRASSIDAVFIFIVPPSWDVLMARLQKRGSESAEIQAQRLAVARQELAHYTEYHYVVVNDRLSTAVHVLQTIIIAERHRVPRAGTVAVESLLAHDPVLSLRQQDHTECRVDDVRP